MFLDMYEDSLANLVEASCFFALASGSAVVKDTQVATKHTGTRLALSGASSA